MNEMQSQNEQIDLLIINCLSKEISQDELNTLRAWIMESEKNRKYFMQLQDIWNSSSTKADADFNSELAYQYFLSRISAFQKETPKTRKLFFTRPPFQWAVAACVAFLLGGLSLSLYNSRISENKFYSVSVPFGAKSKIELPDKSVVWLNAGSTLRYQQNFGQKSRQVSLIGEGYFEIAKNAAMPFVVKANEVSVKVLGTKFDVKAYPDDKQLDVTLLQGSIGLSTVYKPDSSLLLVPNQRAILNRANHNVSISRFQASNAAAWTKGEIIFDEELFGQIVRRLEREYNVTINVKDESINRLCFYGDFRNAQSIEEIFNIMTANNEFHYKMKTSIITVYK
jgi:ferric-dicitrate binding protein FerR (iron transport regulator)